MRIFLSYASKDTPVAEAITHSLQERGHDIFFDRDSLPPGGAYESQIEAAVSKSDLMVFLISDHSVRDGSFALTELGFARKKWKHPANRVLPVMVGDVEYDTIPPYLKAVTVLEPEGNLPAEVAVAVGTMRRFSIRLPLAVAGIAISSILAFSFYLLQPRAEINTTADTPIPWERGYFGQSPKYNLPYSVSNSGNSTGKIAETSLVTNPGDAAVMVSSGPELSTDAPHFLQPGAQMSGHFIVAPKQDQPTFEWQVCVTEQDGPRHCSEQTSWNSTGNFTPATAFELAPEISRRAVAVEHLSDGFLIATRSPGQLHHVGIDGKTRMVRELPGKPTSLLAQDNVVLVGTKTPDSLIRFQLPELKQTHQVAVSFPSDVRGTFDDPVSSTPVSIARGHNRIWIITRGGAAGSGLLHFSETLSDQQLVPYFSTISSDLGDMHLSSNGREVWGSQTNTTPASLHRLAPKKYKEFVGHDWDIASCASDLLVLADYMLVPDCNGVVQKIRSDADALNIVGKKSHFYGYDSSASNWTETHLRRGNQDKALAIAVTQVRSSSQSVLRSVVTNLDDSVGVKLSLEVKEFAIVDLAQSNDIALIVLENNTAEREILAYRNQ